MAVHSDGSYLRVVLFTKDQASNFRCNKDASQWFNRRDALIRCVASFLFGPDNNINCKQKELVILFDQDWSQLFMQKVGDANTVTYPSERNIISLWKSAWDRPGQTVIEHGLSCRIVMGPTSSTRSLPSRMDNKRDILEYIQSKCDIDFMREHRLNSSTAAVLKKTNKQALMKIWEQWLQKEGPCRNFPQPLEVLETILGDLLKPVSSGIQEVIAGTLHETSEHELPYWTSIPSTSSTSQICLFLGAVRDMYETENDLLKQVCRRCDVPLTGIRLGPVAEFTSKILTVVAYHHAQGRLEPAMGELINKQSSRAISQDIAQSSQQSPQISLQVICLVPFNSSDVTVELEKRCRIHWSMVRCIVVTLWRSRLAGKGHNDGPRMTNKLSLVFRDGVRITLGTEDVQLMADKHQAAPCEYQIIKMLCERIDAHKGAMASAEETCDMKEVAASLVRSVLDDERDADNVFTLDLTGESSKGNPAIHLTNVYQLASCSNNTRVAPVSSFTLCALTTLDERKEGSAQMRKAFHRAFRKLRVPCRSCLLGCSAFLDQEAAAITMIQHFCYQNQLLRMIQGVMADNGKPEKKEKKKRKRESRA